MKTQLYVGVAFAALAFSNGAYAQSTGAIDFDEPIVVTASTTRGVNGIEVPDTSKTKAVLTDVFIQRQAPGASINDVINQMPGVSFQNNDPFGSSGGSLNIRGFDASRISQTFDGIPLNDSGNYAIYGNQQLDPELIDSVSVNLGSGDVDSPSAGATGSTVNYRSHVPDKDFGVKLVGSAGDFGFFRIFGLVDTGEFTSFGTRAYFAASHSQNYQRWNPYSKIDKDQYNARIYQPLGDNGDFISLAGHYNVNRNNFQGSVPLRTDLVQRTVGCAVTTTPCPTGSQIVVATTPRIVGVNATDRYPLFNDEAFYTIAPCLIQQNAIAETPAQISAGGYVDPDAANSCGSTFDERYNPSNTGNIRGSARFTLSDGLVLTVDPSYQYVKANGGGTVVAQEGLRDINPAGGTANIATCATTPTSGTNSCLPGYWGGTPYFGRDLNGDGDALDTIRVLAPSQTGTNRISLIASLRWDINDTNTIRVAYTYDRARHRQTGETIFLNGNGQPKDVFAINNPLLGSDGLALQKRDRLSYAILHKVSADYRGKFFDDKLVVNIGVGAPFFRRNLTNNCATSSASGFVECGSAANVQAFVAANPTQTVYTGTSATLGASIAASAGATCATVTGTTTCTFQTQGAQQRVFDYNKILPSAGFTFEVYDKTDVYGSYSKNIQVPGTDNLYNSFYYPAASEKAQPKPEETDNFDVGLRYRGSKLQWQIGGWYTIYTNRLASSYDPDLDKSVYRNLGKVTKYGWDATIAYSPIKELSFYAFGSYLHSKIENDVEIFRTTAAGPLGAAGTIVYAPTAGKRESNAPVYTFGGGANLDVSPFSIGVDIKQTGPRYIYDTNEPLRQVLTVNGAPQTFEIYPAKTPAYTLVDLNARVNMEWAGLNKSTYFQFNVRNVFNNYWVGSINSGNGSLNQGPTYSADGTTITNYGSPPFTQIGYPRTLIASFVMGF